MQNEQMRQNQSPILYSCPQRRGLFNTRGKKTLPSTSGKVRLTNKANCPYTG